MNYAQQQRDPRKHLFGLSAVVIFHIVLVYALANGLARKVVDVIKAPLTVNVIEEVKTEQPPPPPPPKVVRFQPKSSVPPPPAYAPPVEVPVQAPSQSSIATTTTPPPPAPPTPAPAPAAPPAVNVAVACPNYRSVIPEMPRQAERMGLSGEVVLEFTVGAGGEIRDIAVMRSTNSIFNAAATKAVSQYRCVGQGQDVRVRQSFAFRAEN